MTADKDIALIGLGVMGENLALNFASHGFAVCGFDADPAKRLNFARRTQAAACLQEVVAQLKRPRRLLIMVPMALRLV
jgi:6-phosphogluconate dehydrogenase